MDKFGIRALCPTPRGLIELVRKGAHGSRDRDTFRGEKGKLAFPIETSRRYGRFRQPVERDIIEYVVTRQPLGLAIKHARDERATPVVVVEHPGSQPDRGIGERGQRLRAVRHLLIMAASVFVKEVELIPRARLVR